MHDPSDGPADALALLPDGPLDFRRCQQRLWLNGELVFDDESTLPSGHGYHAGYGWKPVQLKTGAW